MCWSSDVGGGLLNGQSSLLTCTGSDTCALQPLAADETASLVYCGSCPSLVEADIHGIFACDTTLQRCVCGAVQKTPQACESTADCLKPGTICGISDTASGVSEAFVTPQCGTCGTMGMEPVCVVNSVSQGGYCACANVRSALLACSVVAGTRVHVASSAWCLIALSRPLSGSLDHALIPTFTTPYADFAVAECLITGGIRDVCVNVQMPLTSTTYGGVRTLVALFKPSPTVNRGRRLLEAPEYDRKVAMKYALQDAMKYALQVTDDERADAKQKLYWDSLCAFVTESHALTDVYNCSAQRAQRGYSQLISRLIARPAWLWDVLREVPFTRPLTILPQSIYDTFLSRPARFANESATTNASSRPVGGDRRLLQSTQNTWTVNLTSVLSDARITNAVSNNPFSNIVGFAALTGVYYKQHVYDQAAVTCNATGWLTCGRFRFPPAKNATNTTSNVSFPLWVHALDVLMLIPTMGTGGIAILDAATSNMPYEQAVAGDYITGTRLVKDLSACNRTALTLGPNRPRNILSVLLMSSALVLVLSIFMRPGTLVTMFLWTMLLPVLVLWGAYTLSPLCFPLLPPVLFRDIYLEVQRLLPTFTGVPKTLVRSGCSTAG